MFKIYIRSKRESQQRRGHYDEYGYGQGEPYGYGADEDYEQQGGHEDGAPHEACCICGDTITKGHIVFVIRGKEYKIHTSCLVTGIAMITNGITLLVGLLKQKFGRDKQLESEER